MMSLLTEMMNAPEEPPKLPEDQHSKMTYCLLGIILGSIVTVVLMGYMSKQAVNMKNKRKLRKGPSSGSPLTGHLDEEKSA
jgi:hypothetical protein